jgi:hypothetical protein
VGKSQKRDTKRVIPRFVEWETGLRPAITCLESGLHYQVKNVYNIKNRTPVSAVVAEEKGKASTALCLEVRLAQNTQPTEELNG